MRKNKKTINRPPVWASQNFITSSAIISRIVNLANLTKADHVVEIGAGKGHITAKLLERCGRVTAIEIDRRLCDLLSAKFSGRAGLQLLRRDFFDCSLPATPYKVFANIPFNRTTDIIRRLTSCENPPEEAWLAVEKGAAKRFMGSPHDNLSSLLIKPFFDAEISYYFRRDDFHPAPAVDTVLLHLIKRAAPDIALTDRRAYARFLTVCLRGTGVDSLLTHKQITTALKSEGLSCDLTSGEMLYVQWLCLFRCYLKFGDKNN